MSDTPLKTDEEPIGDARTSIKIDSFTHESVSVDSVKKTDAFSSINRGITEADLQSRVTAQWLLSEHDKYDACLKQFDELKDLYHEKDKECAIAQGKLQTNTTIEVLYSSTLSMGSALLGAFIPFEGGIKWFGIAVGALLLVCGIMSKLAIKQ